MGIEKNIGKSGIAIVKLRSIEINCLSSHLLVACLCKGEPSDSPDFHTRGSAGKQP